MFEVIRNVIDMTNDIEIVKVERVTRWSPNARFEYGTELCFCHPGFHKVMLSGSFKATVEFSVVGIQWILMCFYIVENWLM